MKKIALLLCIIFLLSTAILAQKLIPLDSSVRYGKLDNGMTYYIRLNYKPEGRADFYIVQNVGAILEEDHQNGLAHFLEHMAFNGTKNFPDKGIINYMETIGAQFGTNINAYTSLDETVYMLRNIPVERQSTVDSSLLILHDWSSFVSLEDEEIDKERGVILEEWRTGAHANRRMWKEGNKQKYPGSQYAKRDIIGDTAVINNFSYDALRSYYKKWYRPDLQAIIIVGAVNTEEVLMSIQRIFADIPTPVNPAERIVYQIPDNKEPIVSIVTDPEAKTSNLGLEYKHTPQANEFKKTEASYSLLLINSLITTMLESRFEEKSINPDASYVGGYAHYGDIARCKDAFQVTVVAKEGQEKKAFEDLLSEVNRVKQFGFTQTEFDRAKKEILAFYEKAYNERDKNKNGNYVREYMGNFLNTEAIPGIKWEFEKATKAFETEITLQQVNTTAQGYISDENLVVDISGPEKQAFLLPTKEEVLLAINTSKTTKQQAYEEKIIDKQLFKKKLKQAKIVEEKRVEQLGTTEWMLSNGIKVIFKETTNKDDEILFSCFSDGGTSLIEKIEKLPSAFFATEVVENNGLGKFTKTDLTKVLAGKVAVVSPSISGHSEGMVGSSSVKDFETLLQLCYLYFTAPRKDNEAFESLMSQYKTMLVNAQTDPRKAFGDSISMFSTDHHPRATLINTETMDKVEQKTALKIYKQRFENPADFTFVFVGNIKKDSVKQLILTYLGGLKTKNKKEVWKDNNVRYPKGQKDCVFNKEMQVSKSSIYFLLSGEMPYNMKNKICIGALADILDIRYTESIREKEGGTYGVRVNAGLTNQPIEQSTLSIRFDTDESKKDKLIGLVFQELDSIVKNGPRADDLFKVKQNLQKQHEENKEENSWWLRTIRLYEEDGINYPYEFPPVLRDLDAEAIQETLKALMKEGNVLKVIMNPVK